MVKLSVSGQIGSRLEGACNYIGSGHHLIQGVCRYQGCNHRCSSPRPLPRPRPRTTTTARPSTDMAGMSPKIRALRCLIREMRRGLPAHETVRHSPAYMYLMKEYRRNSVTDQQYCHEQEEMGYLAQTCATYLESSRRYQELHSEYHSRGERTVKETADIVGFKLPNEH